MRARSDGVCFLPRLAEAITPAAVMAPKVEASCSALRRGRSGQTCESSLILSEPPCSTLPTLLAGLPRSCNRRTPQPDCRSRIAASVDSRIARVNDLRHVNQNSDGRARPSSALEQVVSLRTAITPDIATIKRTRRTQRVLHEERNARQRLAAGREPNCRH